MQWPVYACDVTFQWATTDEIIKDRYKTKMSWTRSETARESADYQAMQYSVDRYIPAMPVIAKWSASSQKLSTIVVVGCERVKSNRGEVMSGWWAIQLLKNEDISVSVAVTRGR